MQTNNVHQSIFIFLRQKHLESPYLLVGSSCQFRALVVDQHSFATLPKKVDICMILKFDFTAWQRCPQNVIFDLWKYNLWKSNPLRGEACQWFGPWTMMLDHGRCWTLDNDVEI